MLTNSKYGNIISKVTNGHKNLYVYKSLNQDGSPSHFASQVYNKFNKENSNSDIIPIEIIQDEKGKYIIRKNLT